MRVPICHRLDAIIASSKKHVYTGGRTDAADKYIEPTVLTLATHLLLTLTLTRTLSKTNRYIERIVHS